MGSGGGGGDGGGGGGPDLFAQFPEAYRAPGMDGGVARLYSRPIAHHDGVVYIALDNKILLADSATFALHGAMGEAVDGPGEELYVCTNVGPYMCERRRGSILVFGIGGHRHAGRCVRRLSGLDLHEPKWVAVGGEGSSLFVVDGARVKRLTRHGVLLQELHMFECTIDRIAVGVGASDGEVWLLCTGPAEWNIYGEPDSTVHVLTMRTPAQQAVARPSAAPQQGVGTAGTGHWSSGDGLGAEYGRAARLSDWQQRTLEAAYHRGEETLRYPYRGSMHTFTLRPPEQMRVWLTTGPDGQGRAAELRRDSVTS